MRAKLLLVGLIFSLSGCLSVSDAYLRADRATYDAISESYLLYVKNDPLLEEGDKEIERNTIRTWKQRLDHYQGISSVTSR